ncbi:hypothetical protein K2173_020240 [Erythroxylum novogranatense]|uniref:Acyl-[acyl-carrier-protein] hydrolase n=1 Tax=Erythroxylum novogranatense TaxID=1862640 RepID=A0AAV8U7G2_9ROSI|nr:hypothetical protein K2173_020240 [Erythroxylum novogranatense]
MAPSSLSSTFFKSMIPSTSGTTRKRTPTSYSSSINTRMPSFSSTHGQPLFSNKTSAVVLLSTTVNGRTEMNLYTENLSEKFKSNPDAIDGRFVHDKRIYREKLTIKSFEIDRYHKLSLATLMGHLQDTALNHVRKIEILEDNFGSTAEMVKNDLIWVLSTSQIVVDCYPAWTDVVQVDTWTYPAGKNGLGRDWLIRDDKTGKTLIRATNVYIMMNKKTRKFSKFRNEVREEFAPIFLICDPITEKDSRKILPFSTDGTAVRIQSGSRAGWNDVDINQHVSNVKYIDWILEGTPRSLKEHHELFAMTLEYRKECYEDSIIQSLSRVCSNATADEEVVELEHLIRLENGTEVMKARTTWKPKDMNNKISTPDK